MVAAQHKCDGRMRILEAARDLFVTRGFHSTAMAELASEAQVSVGQIYRLFQNKNDIILAIVDDDHSEWLASIRQICGEARSGRIALDEAFESLAMNSLRGTETLTFEILAEAGRSLEVRERIACFCADTRLALRNLACQVNDGLSERELEAVTELLLACLFGLNGRGLSRSPVDSETAAADTARLMIAMLRNAAV